MTPFAPHNTILIAHFLVGDPCLHDPHFCIFVCSPRLGEAHVIGTVISPRRIQCQLRIGGGEFQLKITPGDTANRVALVWSGRTIEIERTVGSTHIHAVIVKIAVLRIGSFTHLPGNCPDGMVASRSYKPFNHYWYLNPEALSLFITVVNKLDPMDGMVAARENDRFHVAWRIDFAQ